MIDKFLDDSIEVWISPEFKTKVLTEIEEANIGANKLLIGYIRKGRCKQCGCPYNKVTKGCSLCRQRIRQRKVDKDKRAKALKQSKKNSLPKCHFCLRNAEVVNGVVRCIRCGPGTYNWKSNIVGIIEGR